MKEFSSAPDEKVKILDMFNQHAHHRNHKLGTQVKYTIQSRQAVPAQTCFIHPRA